MSSEQEHVCAALIAVVAVIEEKKRREQRKRIWAREWLRRRNTLGCYQNLMKELALEVSCITFKAF